MQAQAAKQNNFPGQLRAEKFHFPYGLLGFENLKKFLCVRCPENKAFYWLQALEEPITFLLVDPFPLFPHYEVELTPKVTKLLKIKHPGEVLILTLVTLPSPPNLKQATVNLLGPLVLAWKHRRGLQIVLEGTSYQTKHPLFAPSS